MTCSFPLFEFIRHVTANSGSTYSSGFSDLASFVDIHAFVMSKPYSNNDMYLIQYGDCIQDTAAAIMNLHLAACALGLATCWIGSFKEEKIRETLRIPGGIRPVAIVTLGYAAEAPNRRRRRPIDEIVHEEVF